MLIISAQLQGCLWYLITNQSVPTYFVDVYMLEKGGVSNLVLHVEIPESQKNIHIVGLRQHLPLPGDDDLVPR